MAPAAWASSSTRRFNLAFHLSAADLENTMANAFTTEAFTLLGVGVSIVALRLVARTKLVGVRGLQMDDYLMCFATVRLLLSMSCHVHADAVRSSTPSRQQPPTPSEHGGAGSPTTA